MINKLLLIFIIAISFQSFAQKQTAFWYFGDLAGLDFNSGNPIAITDGELSTNEGCAAISNFNGDLLFYTDGVTVWNKNHDIMPNGENLNGHSSSTNSAIIIPKPGTLNSYYIFTVDQLGRANGLQYSEVNIDLDNGLGAVTTDKNILLQTPTTEKITAVRHQNGVDWWVLTHKWNSNEFTAFLVTNSGISPPVSSSIGTFLSGDIRNTVGAMKFAPDGTMVAIANSYENRQVQLFDFDDSTGILSNPITFTGFSGDPTTVYGVEFSIDSKLMYATDHGGNIFQYNTDLPSSTDIINSKILIASEVSGLEAIQIAPNGKIYIARNNNQYLGVIKKPNVIGTGCNYISEGIYLGGRISKRGLPPFIQSFFWREIIAEYTCIGETTQFTLNNPEISQIWNFDDPTTGANNTSILLNPTHTFTAIGEYDVSVQTINFLGQTSISNVRVIISETPTATVPSDFIMCDDDEDSNAANGIIQSFLLSDKDTEILGLLDPTQFDVLYYQDAALTISIDKNNLYENTIAYSQLIFAKVFNVDNDTCFDSVEFNLIVNEIPIFDLESEKIVCSNNLPDSILVENPSGLYDYTWTLDDSSIIGTSQTLDITSLDFIPTEGITITLTAKDPLNNCETITPVFVEKFEISILTIDDVIIEDLTDNNTITISPQDPNFNLDNYEFALDDTNGGIGPYQDNPIFENVIPGVRTIFIRDKFGCDNFTLDVPIIGFPKFFTPNNDGINDTWHILGVSRNFYSSSTIRIFDRFGKIVATILPQSDGWDGFYNNKKSTETDYWFTATLVDNNGNIRNKRGHFSLIRR